MKNNLAIFLDNWPKSYIRDIDFRFFNCRSQQKYDLIHRSFKWGWLHPVRRGLYLIGKPFKHQQPHPFELAQYIYSLSYISLEMALSYHGWIPETVQTMTSVSTKRSAFFDTPQGGYSYSRVPKREFFLGVNRIKNDDATFLVASPWRALADLMYVNKKHWKKLADLCDDMRIEKEELLKEWKTLRLISEYYPSKRVRENLKLLKEEIIYEC